MEIYYAVKDNEGRIIHTTLATTASDAIREHIEIEGTCAGIADAFKSGELPKTSFTPAEIQRGWDHLVNEGYTCVKVGLKEIR